MNTKIIDIETSSIELCTIGDNGPVVVLETGMGCSFYEWSNIAYEISKVARVILCHREGYGNSALTTNKCTSLRIAKNLKLVLEKENITEPIILVGHSFGGMCALHFTKLFPAYVSGLVLVDSSPIEMYKVEELKRSLPSIQSTYPTVKALERMRHMGSMSEEQIIEEVNPKLAPWQLKFPATIQDKIKDFIRKSDLYKATASELENMIASGKEIEDLGSMDLGIPLKVLGRDGKLEINNLINAGITESEATTFENLLQELNKSKALYSSKGEFTLVNGTGHNIHQYCPEIIVEKVLEVVNQINKQ
ncbi:pimeloyl-ACP methyl ester carboxylesterase [Clostridium punense]|uniref:Pimeloyl-ACP methyl ester carboxylesterase n=1 Tax=Clostridium punense TaxID=1054297 RepID=A0ABS4K5Y7_9CLOT|nr:MULTISPECIES: alpha/beta hydrolase [Clostridium]EQB87660.1 hypothetical protein M918_08175 [Clostridium sp. BL8]MBP2022054.1 pimeloyl-ACP methyl ester carboxylesterase [Clostridium punense]